MKKFCLFMVCVCLCAIVCAQGGPRNDSRRNNPPSPYPQDNQRRDAKKPDPRRAEPSKPGHDRDYRPQQESRHPGYQQSHRNNSPNRPGPKSDYRPGQDNHRPGADSHHSHNNPPRPDFRPGPKPPAVQPGHHDSKPNFGISIGPNGIGFTVDHGGHRPFTVGFWNSYKYEGPSWGYMAAGPRHPDSYWMGTTSWDNLRGFFPYRWNRPVPMGSHPHPNYKLAVELAHVNRQLPPNYNPAQERWLPLGTFVMVDDLNYTQDSSYYVQLAVNRDGFVSGSMFNSQDNQVLPVIGRVDPQTQILAFSVRGWSEVFSASVYDLTQNQARVMVMRNAQDYQIDYMVRVQN